MCYIFKCLVLFVIFLYLCKFFIVSYCGWFCFSVLFCAFYCCFFFFFFFFFQAEDGIRDGTVTGVQTCALPICTYFGASNPLTAAQVTALDAGNFYANIHTAANPGGEIRGQLTRLLQQIGRASCRERV